jgi:hypothetical protein
MQEDEGGCRRMKEDAGNYKEQSSTGHQGWGQFQFNSVTSNSLKSNEEIEL